MAKLTVSQDNPHFPALRSVQWLFQRPSPQKQIPSSSSLYKAICYGVIGVISPEIINGIIKLGKKFQADPEKFVNK